MMSNRSLLISLLCLWPTMVLQAQELTLFEATEDAENARQNVVRQPERTQRNNEPAFTLKGNSRFGNTYSTSLLSRDGIQVTVDMERGQSARIEGYQNFTVVDITPRTVTLQLPADEACVESTEKGVKCSTGNLAVLTLANARPLPARTPPEARDVGAEGAEPSVAQNGELETAGQQVLINPFSGEPQVIPELSEEERQARSERQAVRSERLRNFQVNRIAPEDVPEGMRVVSTPFGDRLVPDN